MQIVRRPFDLAGEVLGQACGGHLGRFAVGLEFGNAP
jgi:hypothetical protein